MKTAAIRIRAKSFIRQSNKDKLVSRMQIYSNSSEMTKIMYQIFNLFKYMYIFAPCKNPTEPDYEILTKVT